MEKVKIPKNWDFKYYSYEDGHIKFVYEDNFGQEHIYIDKEAFQDIPTYKDLENRISKAIEYIEKQTKELYKNWDIENFDFEELLNILKGVDKE